MQGKKRKEKKKEIGQRLKKKKEQLLPHFSGGRKSKQRGVG